MQQRVIPGPHSTYLQLIKVDFSYVSYFYLLIIGAYGGLSVICSSGTMTAKGKLL